MRSIRTSVGGILHGMVRPAIASEKRIIWKTVEKRDFLHNLENGVLNRRGIRIRERVKVDRDDRDSIRELLWYKLGLHLATRKNTDGPTYLRAE